MCLSSKWYSKSLDDYSVVLGERTFPRIQELDQRYSSTINLALFNTRQSTMASSTAHKRLLHDYRLLSTDPPDGILAGPKTEDSLFEWEALIQGPEGTPFEGGIFPADLIFPKDYPLAPPTMKFTCEMWHPNGE
jgi:hypothetical protein